MPSSAACNSGIGPTTARRKLWSKAYLRMAARVLCAHSVRAAHVACMWRVWGAGSSGGGEGGAKGGAERGAERVLLGHPLRARVIEPPAVQRAVVLAVYEPVQRPARTRDDEGALGQRPHAQPHHRALACGERELVLVELQTCRARARARARARVIGVERDVGVAGSGGGRVRAGKLERAQLQRDVHRIVHFHLDVDPLALRVACACA